MKNKILDYCDENTHYITSKSVLDRHGVDFRKEKKIDWEKIEERACIAVCVGAVGFMIIHLIILIV